MGLHADLSGRKESRDLQCGAALKGDGAFGPNICSGRGGKCIVAADGRCSECQSRSGIGLDLDGADVWGRLVHICGL